MMKQVEKPSRFPFPNKTPVTSFIRNTSEGREEAIISQKHMKEKNMVSIQGTIGMV